MSAPMPVRIVADEHTVLITQRGKFMNHTLVLGRAELAQFVAALSNLMDAPTSPVDAGEGGQDA
jgi:hypothetical protein